MNQAAKVFVFIAQALEAETLQGQTASRVAAATKALLTTADDTKNYHRMPARGQAPVQLQGAHGRRACVQMIGNIDMDTGGQHTLVLREKAQGPPVVDPFPNFPPPFWTGSSCLSPAPPTGSTVGRRVRFAAGTFHGRAPPNGAGSYKYPTVRDPPSMTWKRDGRGAHLQLQSRKRQSPQSIAFHPQSTTQRPPFPSPVLSPPPHTPSIHFSRIPIHSSAAIPDSYFCIPLFFPSSDSDLPPFRPSATRLRPATSTSFHRCIIAAFCSTLPEALELSP
ncbi:hypothetical protein NM208_g12858 [Fusarium decemcellulare]|uniref:Uncharacterized protein n=1 Tax=Fusarium decemcellulare TaxID=57161 RepID=A0ACC1RM10_9HYPO|nr:hypothetical protein NM208_g12858 [Fusarium decemcellulare]